MDQCATTSTSGPSALMEKRASISTPKVLIVNDCTTFAEMVERQLSPHNYLIQTLSRQDALQPLRLKRCFPDIAFVDCDASAADGLKIHRLIRKTCPHCEIILMCNDLASASTVSELTQSGELFDYFLINSMRDQNRVPLLGGRDWASHMQSVSQEESQEILQSREILGTLKDLRDLLTDNDENPVVEMLHHYKVPARVAEQRTTPLEHFAGNYQDLLVNVIDGRLRRLENKVLIACGNKPDGPAESDAVDHDSGLELDGLDQHGDGNGEHVIGSRIIVVDDDLTYLEMAKFILEDAGFVVDVAQTPEQASKLMHRHQPDLVLMDIHLENANGIQLIIGLRRGSICPNVPVIIVTSDVFRDTLHDALDVDIQGYILKPFDSRLLIEKSRAVLQDFKLVKGGRKAPHPAG